MQAHPTPTHLTPAGLTGSPAHRPGVHSTRPPIGAATSVTGALRAMEAFLLRGGQQTARRNAWTAVVEDRRRARDRREVQHLLDSPGSARPEGMP